MLDRLTDDTETALPLYLVTPTDWADWRERQSPSIRAWLAGRGTMGKPGTVEALPGAEGSPAAWVAVIDADDPWAGAQLGAGLPPGLYRLDDTGAGVINREGFATAWALAGYQFTRYRRPEAKAPPRLIWPVDTDRAAVARLVAAIALGRDLINTPAGDLGPAELAETVRNLAAAHGAQVAQIVGEDLLVENYPMIHAVGRASTKPPRLIDLSWGDPAHPKVTLVGKGVCFDSGGLDLKPSGNMRLMKKDMGGAATAIALAALIMDAGLKVRLRLLVPAVENMVAGNAYHPLDILTSRSGKTVEVGNTDAEGRLILADALTEAVTDAPGLLIDLATLTGAARVALGPELPALFCRQDDLANRALTHGIACHDPLWRLPLWPGYRRMLESKIADLSSTGESPFAGSITAALFLGEFVPVSQRWLHLDLYAWNGRARPGRPEGGEVQALRALFALIADEQAVC